MDPLERAVHDHPSERLSTAASSPTRPTRRGSAPTWLRSLLLVPLVTACVAQPPPNRAPLTPAADAQTGSATDRGQRVTPPTAPSTTPPTALGSCDEASIAPVVRALERVPAYVFSADGFVYAEVFGRDPNAPPRTSRISTAFEGAYVAPDRGRIRYTKGEVAQGVPEMSVAIGRDLWIRTVEGWQHLPGSVDPRDANRVRLLLMDAGPGWESLAAGTPARVPGSGCLFRARVPLDRGRGYRETTVRVDPARALPTALRVVVRDAFDPFRNRHDSDLLYRVRYDSQIRIEPPA